MANPAIVACPADTWTVVATNVTSGAVFNMTPEVPFMQTYRMTGQPAPSSDADAVFAFVDPDAPLVIGASAAIDVYLKAVDSAGSVRVDA